MKLDKEALKKPAGFLQSYKNTIGTQNPRPESQNLKVEAKKEDNSKVELKRVSISQIEDDLDVAEKDAKKSEEVYLKIREWRQKNKAIVDTQGAESHYVRDDSQNERAF